MVRYTFDAVARGASLGFHSNSRSGRVYAVSEHWTDGGSGSFSHGGKRHAQSDRTPGIGRQNMHARLKLEDAQALLDLEYTHASRGAKTFHIPERCDFSRFTTRSWGHREFGA